MPGTQVSWCLGKKRGPSLSPFSSRWPPHRQDRPSGALATVTVGLTMLCLSSAGPDSGARLPLGFSWPPLPSPPPARSHVSPLPLASDALSTGFQLLGSPRVNCLRPPRSQLLVKVVPLCPELHIVT